MASHEIGLPFPRTRMCHAQLRDVAGALVLFRDQTCQWSEKRQCWHKENYNDI
jgi:hypothetical protein